MKKLRFYLKLWLRFSKLSFAAMFYTRTSALLFLAGKLVRFLIIFTFIFAVFSRIGNKVNGYGRDEIIIVLLVYTLFDSLIQFLFREVYRFRPKIIEGSFDFTLTKPFSPLFHSLLSGADLLDLIMTIFYLVIFVGFLILQQIPVANLLLFSLLAVCAVLIASAFHILVLATGVLTTEVDHLIMIYRDIQQLGRIPIEFYNKALQMILTYIIPIGVMITIPAKAIIGFFSPQMLILSFVISMILFYISIKFWQYALRRYASASS